MFFPRVFIEITNICDSTCIYCPNSIQERKRGSMDIELFKKVVDDLFSNHKTKKIDFHILGEPLLHRIFFEMVSYICSKKKYPVTLEVTTNGNLLIKDSIQKGLLNSELDIIGISVRASDEHEYRLKVPKNSPLNYEDYIESIKSFIRKVHEANSNQLVSLGYFHTVNSAFTLVFPYPFITEKSQILNVTKSWHDLIKGYKQTIPFEKIKIPSLIAGWSYEKNVSLSRNLEIRIEGNGLWQNKLISDDYFVKEASFGKCSLYDNLSILCNGDIVGCCLDINGENSFGNLQHSSINEIITSKKYTDFKKNIEKSRLTLPLCKRCIGTICKKDSGEEIKLGPPKFIKYYYLIKENPGLFLKTARMRFAKYFRNGFSFYILS